MTAERLGKISERQTSPPFYREAVFTGWEEGEMVSADRWKQRRNVGSLGSGGMRAGRDEKRASRQPTLCH